MTRRLFALSVLAILAFGQKKGKEGKPPEVELLEATVHRQEGNVTVDARVKNVGEKPIKALNIVVDFVAPDHKQVITTKRGAIQEPVLDPGEEAEFHAQIEDPSRATEFHINFEDGNGRYLRGEKTGPFPIE
jgi:hypothetical protein